MRKFGSRLHRLVKDPDVVMLFEGTDEAAEHDHALLFRRFLNLDHLKTARKGRVLLKILLVLRPSGRRDGAQFATRQRRLQEIGSIALTGSAAGANHGVGFVNEKDDWRGRRLNLFNKPFQAILEFSFDSGSRLEEGKIQRTDGDILQRRRDVARSHAQRKAFDDGRLADTGFAGENGIVLAAASEDVNDLANFVVASKDGIHFPRARIGSEIDRELIEILRFAAARSAGGTG